MITLSIDVTLLDKHRFKRVTKKNGKEAVYAELVLFETPTSDYGDYIVKQGVTKEERQQKKDMPILGNGKVWDKKGFAPKEAAAQDVKDGDEVSW